MLVAGCPKGSSDYNQGKKAEVLQDYDAALGYYQKAVKAEPDNAAYLDSLGWVLFKLKQPKQALDYLLKAVQLAKEPDATVYDHLGDTYAALDQPKKAREAWRKSLELEPSPDVRKKLEGAGAK
jgi:tetratricopeptide (TPR) repeat protein